jgi:hypothetical protein
MTITRAELAMVARCTSADSRSEVPSERRHPPNLQTTKVTQSRAEGRNSALVFERGQGLQHLAGPRPTENRIVLADSSIPEDQHAFRELCDVVFVSHQYDS